MNNPVCMDRTSATVFVIDDDAAVRCGLQRLIRSAGWGVEAFASAQEFLEHRPVSVTGCLVLDVHMPVVSGTELYDRLCASGSALPVIFLTGQGDVPTSVQAMKKGAVDFLLKPVEDDILLQAIGQAVGRSADERLRDSEQQEFQTRLDLLSMRERQVMEYVIGGMINKHIAAELDIAYKTVKVHRGRVMEKMRANSVADLVRLCEVVGIQGRR